MRRLIVALVGVLACAGCSVRQPVNPPRLVTDSQTDMSIQLFMQATILLSHYYGYSTIEYADFQQRTVRAGYSAVPFMPPESVRATPELINLRFDPTDPTSFRVFLDRTGYKLLSKYYITTGLRASQLICRNYLLGLDEKNQYLEFLRREFGVAYGLASGILALANANGTITNSFFLASTAINNGLTAYEEYRFLNIDREAARVLVDAAMNKYAEYFIGQVDYPPNGVIYTFSDALNAVSVIEYQCTREGIRNLLNRSVNNTPTNLMIDSNTGTVAFFSSRHTEETLPPRGDLTAIGPGAPGASTAHTRTGTGPNKTNPPPDQGPGKDADKDPVDRFCKAPPDAACTKLVQYLFPNKLLNKTREAELFKLLQKINPRAKPTTLWILLHGGTAEQQNQRDELLKALQQLHPELN